VSERRYGSFRRSLQVPGSVDAEKIESSFKNGVLTVTLPKSPEAQKKQKTVPVTVKIATNAGLAVSSKNGRRGR
jgi:HSP20 family protein